MLKNTIVYSIILARENSKGIKNKNLKKINSKPLIYWSIKQSLESKLVQKTFVSSDSKKILTYSKKIGAEVIYRPLKYGNSKTSSEISWLHAIKKLEQKKINFNTVLGIQPTSPIREKEDFDKAIKLFKKKKFESLFSANKTNDTNLWHFKKSKILSNYNFKKRKMRQDIDQKYLENGSFYIFDKKKFLKKKCRLFGKIGMYLMKKINSFQIDDMEDVELINTILQNKK